MFARYTLPILLLDSTATIVAYFNTLCTFRTYYIYHWSTLRHTCARISIFPIETGKKALGRFILAGRKKNLPATENTTGRKKHYSSSIQTDSGNR